MTEIQNVTKHGTFRYFQRIKGDVRFLVENSFNEYVKKNQDEFEDMRNEILEVIRNSELQDLGNFSLREHEKSDFLLDTNNRIIYIVKQNSLITCYQLKFLAQEEENDIIFRAFLSSMDKCSKEIEEEENQLSRELDMCDTQLQDLEIRKQKLLLELEDVEDKKNSINNNINNLKKKITINKEEIKNIVQKLLTL
jgi:hypothetical protein|nr:MAG TPA: hypothetical protein [Caudoviricetes sp.]